MLFLHFTESKLRQVFEKGRGIFFKSVIGSSPTGGAKENLFCSSASTKGNTAWEEVS